MRSAIGLLAALCFAWRQIDPVGSYVFIIGLSEAASSLFVEDQGIVGYALRGFIGNFMVNQIDGVLLGLSIACLFDLILWPFRLTWKCIKNFPSKERN